MKFKILGFLLSVAFNLLGSSERPNIIFFIADDVSQDDFGCYGHPVIKTPHIDSLSANGMRFDNAYLTTSSCSPSRCSIITGRYPHNTGAPELHVRLPQQQVRFPELLREAGYYTVLSGKNHMFGNKDRAFDRITGGGGPGKEEDWVRHVKDRPKDKPFFFWFASTDAHRAWSITKEAPKYDPRDVIIPPYLVDTAITREDLTGYYHEVSRFDYYIGLVTAELKKQGVLENTMIVVAADNGSPFPRCKSRMYDSGIKTPWVVHFPEVIKNPAVTQSLISVIDLSATCLELAGIKSPESIQGRSFLPILKTPETTIREVVFAEHNWHVYRNHERMVRFGHYLYIKNNYPNQPNLCYESDDHYPAGEELWKAHAAGKTQPDQQQVFANPCPPEELFQVKKDPHQLSNLVSDEKHQKALKRARALLSKWTKQTGDSIPDNPTPNRHDPPRIENGKILPAGKAKTRNPHAEMPGASHNAFKINHSGPIKL
ncbi:sulfatase [Opitutales bacterium]|nr:sulfatase [Opitutales bacterium]